MQDFAMVTSCRNEGLEQGLLGERTNSTYFKGPPGAI